MLLLLTARKKMDADLSGSIERSELETFAQKAIGAECAAAVVEKLFLELDKDTTGVMG